MHWQTRRYALKCLLVQLLLPILPAGKSLAAVAPRILAFGDSLTAGYQLAQGEGFAPRLQAELARRGVPAVVQNAGVSGDTTAQGRARLAWVLGSLADKPALVILELGANDMLRGLSVAEASANLDWMLGELRRRGIPVLLAGMLAAPNMGADYGRQFNAIYPALAKKHGVPLYPFFLDGVQGKPALQLADGMHPNGEGTKVMAARIAPLVQRLLQ